MFLKLFINLNLEDFFLYRLIIFRFKKHSYLAWHVVETQIFAHCPKLWLNHKPFKFTQTSPKNIT